jgi:hypothetical protein
MTSVITGDVINSRHHKQETWLLPLKKMLAGFGRSPLWWEITRGDSFQLEVANPAHALLAAIAIKACIKAQGATGLDVRMAIGTGNKTYQGNRISECTGSAFVRSGDRFEGLKKEKLNLAIQTGNAETDIGLNIMMRLALMAMDKWTAPSAEVILLQMTALYKTGNYLNQKELERTLKLKQSSVSERIKRAHFGEISEFEQYFRNLLAQPAMP